MMEFSCAGQGDVEKLAANLVNYINAGDLLALTGDLGAGKTTFSRAFIRMCLGDAFAEVPSPTFTLVQTYDTEDGPIYHTDLYRLQEPDEVYDLGLDDDRSEAILLVEWPDRMPEDWWDGALKISLKRPADSAEGEDEARTISFAGNATWQARLAGLAL